jgi:hypothetical protein
MIMKIGPGAPRVSLLVVLLVTACAGRHRPQPPATRPATRPSADHAYLVPTQGAFRITRTGEKPRVLDYRVTPPASGPWWTERLEGLRTTEVEQTDGGDILIGRELDLESNVAVAYDPAIPALPGDLSTGQVIRGASRVTVTNLKTGAKRDEGTCSYTMEVLGPREVDTPAGRYQGYTVRSVRKLDLKLARVTVTVDTTYASGVGEVAEHVTENVKALGLFGSTKEEDRQRVR